ncbi:MAG: lipase family protein [Phormidesmis sp.]
MDYKTALQCACLSEDVYQNFSGIQFKDWTNVTPVLIEDAVTDTQVAILKDPAQQLAVIVFRGSDGDKDWDTNVMLGQTSYEWSREDKKEYKEKMKAVSEAVTENEDLIYPEAYSKPKHPVKMHRGFSRAYLSVRDRIHDIIKDSNLTRCRVTGHSLGGAIASLCAVDLQYNFSPQIAIEAYTFGSPRVGNQAFVESYNKRVPDTWRVVNGWDAVVGVPVPWQGYRHVDTSEKLERGFTWRIVTGSFEDHRISDYIKALKERITV